MIFGNNSLNSHIFLAVSQLNSSNIASNIASRNRAEDLDTLIKQSLQLL